MDICTNPDILKVIYFFLLIIDIVKIIIPIGLIIIGIIDFSKAIISSDEKDQKKCVNLFLKRLLYGVLVFATPWIIEVVMITLGDLLEKEGTTNYADCITNSKNISYYEELAKIKEKAEEERKANEQKEEKLNNLETSVIKNNSYNNNSNDGNFIGQKYNLTDTQLRGIARLCQQEQGSATGAAAEASLMANQFELFGSKYGVNGDGLYNYVAKSGWFHKAEYFMSQTDSLRQDVYTAVYNVLVLGKRTLPLYINEHDCIDCGSGFDIIKLVTDNTIITDEKGLLNRSNYIQDKTTIYNRYSSIYTFYTFPTEYSDPFGYTESAKKKYDSLNGN